MKTINMNSQVTNIEKAKNKLDHTIPKLIEDVKRFCSRYVEEEIDLGDWVVKNYYSDYYRKIVWKVLEMTGVVSGNSCGKILIDNSWGRNCKNLVAIDEEGREYYHDCIYISSCGLLFILNLFNSSFNGGVTVLIDFADS